VDGSIPGLGLEGRVHREGAKGAKGACDVGRRAKEAVGAASRRDLRKGGSEERIEEAGSITITIPIPILIPIQIPIPIPIQILILIPIPI